jgi:D-3-phosphoglycerate dehydrogenase
MTRILIVGDKFFDPVMVGEELKNQLSTHFHLAIETVKYDFPVEHFMLDDDTCVPSGMSWDDPNQQKEPCGVREFYGEPFALLDKLLGIDILIVHGAAVPREVLEQADRLKAVVILRGGPVNIDRAYLEERGITIYNTNGKNAEGVAEFTIGLLLSFLRNIPESSSFLKQGIWKPGYYEFERTGVELYTKTFGLIGFGRIARHLARILNGFQMNVVAYDPFVQAADFTALGVTQQPLEQLLAVSDFVSLHARQPKGAGPILNATTLGLMKPEAVLINTARGDLIDYPALKERLASKRLRGAVLDVFGDEPFAFYNELLALPNVLGTPHIAGGSQETVKRGIHMTAQFLESFLAQSR